MTDSPTDRSAEQGMRAWSRPCKAKTPLAIQSLSVALDTDAAAFKTRELDVEEYTIVGLSHTVPPLLPATRLDVRFTRAHAQRAADFLWLTLVPGTDNAERVVLVDGRGLDGVAERDLGLAVLMMRVEAGLMLVGEGEEETPVVRVLERVAPKFREM